MEIAQPGLGRLAIALLVLRRARLIIRGLSRSVLAEMPDRMDERDLLSCQEQEGEQDLQNDARRHKGCRPVYLGGRAMGNRGATEGQQRPDCGGCYTGRR